MALRLWRACKRRFCPPKTAMFWSWMNFGRMWATRKTRCGYGSRSVVAPGRWWPGITVRARCSAVASCGKRFRPPTKRVSSSRTCGRRIKRWCPTTSTDPVSSRKEKQIRRNKSCRTLQPHAATAHRQTDPQDALLLQVAHHAPHPHPSVLPGLQPILHHQIQHNQLYLTTTCVSCAFL